MEIKIEETKKVKNKVKKNIKIEENKIKKLSKNSKIQKTKITKYRLLVKIFQKSFLIIAMLLSNFRSFFFFIWSSFRSNFLVIKRKEKKRCVKHKIN